MIRDETDRICGIVDRMEGFSTSDALQREAVNVHEVLGRVRARAFLDGALAADLNEIPDLIESARRQERWLRPLLLKTAEDTSAPTNIHGLRLPQRSCSA